MTPFPNGNTNLAYAPGMTLEEVEENVRSNGSVLTDGNSQVSSLYYVDPQRFEATILTFRPATGSPRAWSRRTCRFPSPNQLPRRHATMRKMSFPSAVPSIVDAMVAVGYPKPQAEEIASHLSEQIGSSDLQQGDVLRVGLIQEGELVSIIRTSLYRRVCIRQHSPR